MDKRSSTSSAAAVDRPHPSPLMRSNALAEGCTMNPDDPDGNHKDFENYVQFSLGKFAEPDKVCKDNTILEAMTTFSKLPTEDTRRFLGWGTKPTIKLGFKSMFDNGRSIGSINHGDLRPHDRAQTGAVSVRG